jgi:hypothetical protein
LIVACAVAALLMTVLTIAAIGGRSLEPSPQILAGCTHTQSGTSSSIVCSPDATGPVSGAPSEAEITAKNAQRTRGYVIGGPF